MQDNWTFYDKTVNAAGYVNNIVSPYFAELTQEERLYGVFQQDSATAHMANISLEALQEVFGDCMISCGLWPPRSLNLTPCDFYFWGSLKDKVYKTNPHTLEELRNNICHEISAVSREELQRVNTSVFHRYTECIRSGGDHFQHMLYTGEFLLHFLKIILTAIAYCQAKASSPTATPADMQQVGARLATTS
jgi:hypothetical protein